MPNKILRIFSQQGIDRFRQTIDNLQVNPEEKIDLSWIHRDSLATEAGTAITIPKIKFDSKLESAKFLHEIIGELTTQDKFYNPGLWAWLSAFFFDTVCPENSTGKRKPGKSYRHIPPKNRNWRTIHRHLLAGPVRIYDLHQKDIKIIFHAPVHKLGDFMEQLASRQEIAASMGVLKAADLLYWDPERDQPKIGARSTEGEPGTLRRFVTVLQQLMLTYDLYSMTAEEIITLLPEDEFGPWLVS